MSTTLDNAINLTVSGRSARLRQLLAARELFFLMEAHDGLSARIADEAGFPAIWASGLSISTALGVRDSDEASWSQILGVVSRIVDASSVPVVVDGDTGYGNFNSARRFVRQAELIGASAVSFEDKTFPKMNSFVGDSHQLAPVAEFCGKLRASKDATSADFCLIARTEALIAGRSVAEALDRASAYADAGADAIFIHSRQKTAAQIDEFAAAWKNRLPLIIAPTTYAAATPSAEFRRMGITGLIWANQNMRAAFAAMRQVCQDILKSEGIQHVEDRLAPLGEVFGLLDYDGLASDEARYCELAAEPR